MFVIKRNLKKQKLYSEIERVKLTITAKLFNVNKVRIIFEFYVLNSGWVGL